MIFFLMLIMLVMLLLSGVSPAQAAPLLADGNTVTPYVGIFVVMLLLVWLGCKFGSRDRAKVKADLLEKPKIDLSKANVLPAFTQEAKYRIREYLKATPQRNVVSYFQVEMWDRYDQGFFSIGQAHDSLAAAESLLVERLKMDQELQRPTLTHEYMADGTPIPPAPALSIPK